MSNTVLRIATRKSPLALWQARHVQQLLQRHHPQLQVELVPLKTRGDIILDTPLARIGGKGLFVKELEQALLDGRADIAVHSMKDVPALFPDGLDLIAICEREDPRDAFVSSRYASLQELPLHSVVGTASLRRQSQLLALRPDLRITTLRGNVGTRLTKLDEGEFDAIILASSGLKRLGLTDRIRAYLSPEISLPAPGQGAIGIEARADDARTRALLAPLHHPKTAQCVLAERAVNARLNGSCQVPLGSYAEQQSDTLWLRALVGTVDGRRILRSECRGPVADAVALGDALAETLLSQGADAILAQLLAQED